jgi:V8-like Glu-specific endopeptidase
VSTKERSSTDYTGEVESPFLDEELFVGESEQEWEPRVAALAAESPFQSVKQGRGPFDSPEMEEPRSFDEEPFSEGETGVINGDNRVRVKNTFGVPWRWICKISIRDNQGRPHSGGTGVLIADRHVLTAAHVVYPEYIDPYNYSIGFCCKNF